MLKIGLTAVVGWGAVALLAFVFVACGDSAKAGQFGDFFGAFNCLLSALAVGGALYAVNLQLEELKDARTERRIQEDSRAASEASEMAAREVQAKSGIAQAQGILLSSLWKTHGILWEKHKEVADLHTRALNAMDFLKDEHGMIRDKIRGDVIATCQLVVRDFVRSGYQMPRVPIVNDQIRVLASQLEDLIVQATNKLTEVESQRLGIDKKMREAERKLADIISGLDALIDSSSFEPPPPPE